MAFSMEVRLYVAVYTVSTDASKDAQHANFVVASMNLMDRHTKGSQLADENLPAVPKKFMETGNYLRLERLRKEPGPDGRFYGYIRVPGEFQRARESL